VDHPKISKARQLLVVALDSWNEEKIIQYIAFMLERRRHRRKILENFCTLRTHSTLNTHSLNMHENKMKLK